MLREYIKEVCATVSTGASVQMNACERLGIVHECSSLSFGAGVIYKPEVK